MYSRARDYCTSTKHLVELCKNAIRVSLWVGQGRGRGVGGWGVWEAM